MLFKDIHQLNIGSVIKFYKDVGIIINITQKKDHPIKVENYYNWVYEVLWCVPDPFVSVEFDFSLTNDNFELATL